MAGRTRRSTTLLVLAAALGCRQAPAPAVPLPPAAPPLPQVSGAIALDGLTARVTITRDSWGIPHIVAATQDDLFFAQGFVQAQDRLFQMDLWRRSVQGRLSEVLGSNFIERDAMTRRMQYRGALEAEWASYGSDARAISTAFTRGINAWVTQAGQQLPEEFALAGWAPEAWAPEDLLNRTDAFLASRGADDELLQARLAGVVGPAVAARLLGAADPGAPPTVDLQAINFYVGDMLRRVGTTPFFSGLFAPVPGALPPEPAVAAKPLPIPIPPLSGVAFALAPERTATGAALVGGAATATLESPAGRYLVHLQAPGWNVIGATAPWRPGVAIGHNERIAWSFTPAPLDTQDVVVERLNPANPHQVADADGQWRDMTVVMESVAVKGRKEPFVYEKQYTPHGVVVALDRERHLAYTLRWSGAESGTAAEMAALAVARAQTLPEFQSALKRWKLPTAEFVYADVEGRVATQTAGLVPARAPGRGRLPSAGWQRDTNWRGWVTADRLPSNLGGRSAALVAAPDNPARTGRMAQRLAGSTTPAGARAALRDVLAWNAGQLVPLLSAVTAADPIVEEARQRLLRWDRAVTAESRDALLYVIWEHALRRRLGSMRIPSILLDEFVLRSERVLVPALTMPSNVWFDGDAVKSRDALLVDALTAAVDDERRWTSADASATWGRFQSLTFHHVLAISPEARRRYDAGPFVLPGYHGTVFATGRAGTERSIGPALEYVFDLSNWDASRAIIAPGQSAAPDSPHFGDLGVLWVRGDSAPLRFSAAAIEAVADTRLTLTPR